VRCKHCICISASKINIYTNSLPEPSTHANASSSFQLNYFKNYNTHLASLDSRSGVDAVLGRALGDRLRLVTRGGTLELLADSLDASSAGTSDRGSATEVGVDASEDLSVVGLDVLDDDAAGDGVLAVTACAVELAEVHDS
jgi:hypothetical protein